MIIIVYILDRIQENLHVYINDQLRTFCHDI